MAIEVLCPEGHKVVCPDEKAGQAAKCPKCGTKFLIPELDEDSELEPDVEDGMIVFLCPNGHKLNGPATLQGKPGQCPHCGTRFVIPDYSEEEESEEEDRVAEEEEPQVAGESDELAVSLVDDQISEITESEPEPAEGQTLLDDLQPMEGLDSMPAMEGLSAHDEFSEVSIGSSELSVEFDDSNIDAPLEDELSISIGAHPMATTFESFWSRRGDGAVELQLKNGDKIRPEYFAVSASQQDQGIFGIKNDDGTYTVFAVAWEAVARITLRGIEDLPGEIFC